MTLGDFQDHMAIANLFKWYLWYSFAAVENISTGRVRFMVPL